MAGSVLITHHRGGKQRVSCLLLPMSNVGLTALSSSEVASVTQLLQKYDVISLQPMNEPALQGICDLLLNRDALSSKTSVDFIEQIT